MEDEIDLAAERALGIAPPRRVVAEGMNPPGTGFRGEIGKHVRRHPAPQDEARTEGAEIGIQTCEAVVQPPALGTADAAVAGRFIVEDVYRNHPALARRGGKGGLVGEAEILAEPNDRTAHAFPFIAACSSLPRPLLTSSKNTPES
ncbi:hypothetical protein SmB9_19530 [Sphingosinicella microcystinivorans]|uniref:Uncharacterized protein n=1 Tax=Sphingosinicella microcystinivorans TaxID=335406 RepID=A0AAD1D5R1_SPHMI|nr:hypothetical protein SmB9_19530 [Sphingosinicella microcystinivorans]